MQVRWPCSSMRPFNGPVESSCGFLGPMARAACTTVRAVRFPAAGGSRFRHPGKRGPPGNGHGRAPDAKKRWRPCVHVARVNRAPSRAARPVVTPRRGAFRTARGLPVVVVVAGRWSTTFELHSPDGFDHSGSGQGSGQGPEPYKGPNLG
jgi:hypothetical protein